MASREHKPHTIEVDDYYDKVHQSTWTRRSAGMMAGATLGAGYGAVIGAVAAYIPSALAMIPALGVVAPAITVGAVAASAAVFAGIAGLLALGAVAVVGGEAASVASGLAEKEKREKTGLLKENGLMDPSANPELKLKETSDKWPAPIKLRTAMFTVPLFAAFGALLAINPITAPTVIGASGMGSLGLAIGKAALDAGIPAASTAAVAAASSIIFGMWGVVFATPQSYYTNKLTNFYTKVLKDKLFDDKDVTAEVNSMVTAFEGKEKASELTSHTAHHSKQFASEKPHFSFQGLLDKEKHTPDHLIGR